jgi:antitoxin component YwqK of YwqJK toxin-antitoxin module
MKALLILLFSLSSLFLNSQEKFIKKYENGSVAETGYFDKRGNRDSTWTSYFENGKVHAVANFVHGIKSGVWTIYYENQALMYKMEYSNGVRMKVYYYDEKGTLITKLE